MVFVAVISMGLVVASIFVTVLLTVDGEDTSGFSVLDCVVGDVTYSFCVCVDSVSVLLFCVVGDVSVILKAVVPLVLATVDGDVILTGSFVDLLVSWVGVIVSVVG